MLQTLLVACMKDNQIKVMALRFLSILLFALALTGAPFGMGRMMDTAHATYSQTGHIAHETGHSGQPQPEHPAQTLHFTLCAACVASLPEMPAAVFLLVLTAPLQTARPPVISGLRALPPTPPPRA